MPVTVIRDFNRDNLLDFTTAREETGIFGINIHRASLNGRTINVNKWSAGCQVFADSAQFTTFITILTRFSVVFTIIFAFVIALAIARYVMRELGGEPTEVFAITREVMNGNLMVRFDTARKKQSVYGALQDMTEKLKSISVIHIADNIDVAGDQINSTMQQMSQIASEQAASVEEISSSIEKWPLLCNKMPIALCKPIK